MEEGDEDDALLNFVVNILHLLSTTTLHVVRLTDILVYFLPDPGENT